MDVYEGDYIECDLGCGGEMKWCTCCLEYTHICCVNDGYGSCYCS